MQLVPRLLFISIFPVVPMFRVLENINLLTINVLRRKENSQSIWIAKHLTGFYMMGSTDCNWTQTQNHLALKRTLNYLAKLA